MYNSKKDLANLIQEETIEECRINYEFYYHPLSLVNVFYSYESGEGGVVACGVPGNMLQIQTINLITKKSVSLTDVFTEDSILKALKKDAWIQTLEKETNTDFQSITTF